MYEAFYGFREKPFALTPDPRFLYLAPPHRKALAMLEYSIGNHAAFCLVSGEIGAGKTTLICHLLKSVESTAKVGLITNTSPSLGGILRWICSSFGLDYKAKGDVELYELFTEFLRNEGGHGRKVILIVDEAQNLGQTGLEELRVLSNVNVGEQFLLQVVLVGQPELRNLIRIPELRQLAQRVGADHHIGPLSMEEARRYILHRLRVAGAKLNLFTHSAVILACQGSSGIPRLINQFCDQALVYGYAERHERIDYELMAHAIEDRRKSGLISP